MFCPNCGNKLEDGAVFCGNCGTKVGGDAPQPEQATPATEPAPAAPVATEPAPAAPVAPAAPAAPAAPQPAPVAPQPAPVAPAAQPAKKKKKTWIPITAAIASVCVIGGGVGYYLYANSPSRLYKAAMSEGNALLDEKEYKKAIKTYLEAKKYDKAGEETDEALLDAYLGYAKQLEKEEDLEGAAEQYEKALELAPDDKKIQKNLAKTYAALAESSYDDDKDEAAISYAKKALELDKENEDAKYILSKLGEDVPGEGGTEVASSEASSESSSEVKPSSSEPSSDPFSASSGESVSIASSSSGETISYEDPYKILTDADGNVYDLGGMEIIIRDWWSAWPTDDTPRDEYEEARHEYLKWIQETYNFTIHQEAISDWGSTPSDFIEYASSWDDGRNYIWVLRNDPSLLSAMKSGLCYDLSSLDCLDFSEKKFQLNKTHELFNFDGHVYAMWGDYSEARVGVFFNERLLREAGIDPEEIYDLQKSGQWTFDKFEDLCRKVRRDINGDGVWDIWSFAANDSVFINQAVYSNNGEYIGKDASGKLTYELESPETLAALNWAHDMINEYRMEDPEGANWDYYKNAFLDGQFVFLPDQAYLMNYDLKPYPDPDTGVLTGGMLDPVGFVMFPMGPSASDYTNCWENNFVCIPANYDADKAWKIAFAWNLYTNANTSLPGYEDYATWMTDYVFSVVTDVRAYTETLTMMTQKGMVSYNALVPDLELGNWLTWNIIKNGPTIADVVDMARDNFKAAIDSANAR